MTNRRWWTVLGPWEFRPLLLAVIYGFFFVALLNGSRFGNGERYSSEWLLEGMAGGLLVGVLVGAVAYLGLLWQKRFGLHVGSYVFFVFFACISAVAVRIFLGDVSIEVATDPVSVFAAVMRLVLAMFLILALTGLSARRLQDQVTQTQEALELAREQSLVLLKGDEFTRRQIATALHDRVQARLIAACLQLQAVDVDNAQTTRGTIDSVIVGLEEVRGVDVRRAARALSPSLTEMGLRGALVDLGQQYEPGMRTSVQVDEVFQAKATRPAPSVLLGVYRIVEQTLLNAAGHGAANTCKVIVRAEAEGALKVTVTDDGRGFADHNIISGFGSTLMTTWTQSLGGKWSWRSGTSGGVTVEVWIPTASSHL